MVAIVQVSIFSLRREDLIHGSCYLYVCSSVCHAFPIFQKRGFKIINIDVSNTTKLIMLDVLLREVTMGVENKAT